VYTTGRLLGYILRRIGIISILVLFFTAMADAAWNARTIIGKEGISRLDYWATKSAIVFCRRICFLEVRTPEKNL
jgi:hypothetical protein